MTTKGVAYPPLWRIVAGALVAISRGSLPLLLALLLFSHNPPILPFMLMRAFTILVIAPATLAWLLERAFAVTARVADGDAVLEHRRRRTEVPCTAITRVAPWIVPVPGSGLWLRLRSGRRLRYGLQLADPTPVLAALADAGAADAARAAQHPSVVYAHAKHAAGPRRWHQPLVRFALFALVPTLPLFRVHQHIAYGGTWGEWYLLGPASYMRTFAVYYATLTIYLILYAGFLRGLAEAVALTAAWVAPSRAARVRRAVERSFRVLYYGGVPVFVIVRFLPW